jgi:hypothetical protein
MRWVLLVSLLAVQSRLIAQEIAYSNDVRPILSDKCFFCHGPDVTKNKARLRLDTAEGAYKALRSGDGHAIVPGKPLESEVYTRMISDDPATVMPPPNAKLSLSEAEKAIIKKWIEQGAGYQQHWAFQPLPKQVNLPDPQGAAHPIDQFVIAKLQRQQLKLAPEAEPLRWLRRVTLDLTGLPPTLQQIATFEMQLKTDRKNAYERAVNGLLASRSFGEHQAVPWLDAARYTDTFGYHSDSDFTPWPYRDWVVAAFNDNMPYDRFITLNLAGDLLPQASRQEVVPTAFNRLHRITNEGGSVWEEFFVDGVADRVHTVGTAFMGLTMECSRCHDHKYDPITMKDYYGLFAFFNSINETGVYNHGKITPPPSIMLPTAKQENELAKKVQRIRALEARLIALEREAEPRFQAWKSNASRTTPIPDQVGHFTFDEKNAPLRNRIEPPPLMFRWKPYQAKLDQPTYVPGPKQTAVKLDGDRGIFLEKFFLIDRWTPFTTALWLKDTLQDKKPVYVWSRCFGHDVGYNGISLELEDGHLEAKVFRAWPDNGIGVRTKERLPRNEWVHISFSYDGSSRPEGLKLFRNGKQLETIVTGSGIHKAAASETIREGHFTLGSIFRGRGFQGGEIDELQLFQRALTSIEIEALADVSPLQQSIQSSDANALKTYYLGAVDTEYRATTKDLTQAREELVRVEDAMVELPVMREMEQPRPAWVLARGAYDAKRSDENRVGRETMAWLLPFPKNAPRNRLGLAQWLTHPEHPLTARVFVNRVWQQFFGRGLVGTTENFGHQGEEPTHPELLDWLCRDFINSGWNVKRLCKQIVLSATYRQQSAGSAELFTNDPYNRLLARGPSHRLSAEAIRDLALSSSGLLDEKFGGPPVRPYDPKNNGKPVLNQVHARSIYSYWRRTRPLPNMIALDRPSLEVCVVKRSRTNSPAQALVLLNDTQFVEAARVLASSCLATETELTARLIMAWMKVTGLRPTAAEQKLLEELHTEQLAYFREDRSRAEKLIKVGLKPTAKDMDAVELAAFTVVCQAILNSDAAIWKR